jgi:hypothetical protein
VAGIEAGRQSHGNERWPRTTVDEASAYAELYACCTTSSVGRMLVVSTRPPVGK